MVHNYGLFLLLITFFSAATYEYFCDILQTFLLNSVKSLFLSPPQWLQLKTTVSVETVLEKGLEKDNIAFAKKLDGVQNKDLGGRIFSKYACSRFRSCFANNFVNGN